MNNEGLNSLEITPTEKKKLRAHKIKVKEMHYHTIASLQQLLSVPKIRAMELYALSEFQSLPSIGVRFAHDLISMGYYSLKDLKKKNGARLTDQFEVQSGVWVDSCVEDQFRLVVHYANHPESKLNWWDFTKERKAFRAKKNYPVSRPKKPWFELPQYQTSNRIQAASDDTRKDLHQKLRRSLTFMKRHYHEKLTVSQLANQAHVSVYHYIRCFRNAYDVTPIQYLTRLRLKHACLLLKKSDLGLTQLVPQCGFEDKSSFIRLFREEFKLTPIAYRRTFGQAQTVR